MTRKVHALPEDELARLAGVSETTWRDHKKAGAPVPHKQSDIQPWLAKYHAWRKANGKVQTGASAEASDPEVLNYKREHAKLKVVLARIEVGERMRSLVPRKDVVEAMARAAASVRGRLNTMVRKLAARIGPLCGEGGTAYVEGEMQAEVDAICELYERGMESLDDEQAGAGSPDPSGLAATEATDGQRVGRS